MGLAPIHDSQSGIGGDPRPQSGKYPLSKRGITTNPQNEFSESTFHSLKQSGLVPIPISNTREWRQSRKAKTGVWTTFGLCEIEKMRFGTLRRPGCAIGCICGAAATTAVGGDHGEING